MAFPKLFIPRKTYLEISQPRDKDAADELANYLAIERWANSLISPAGVVVDGFGARDISGQTFSAATTGNVVWNTTDWQEGPGSFDGTFFTPGFPAGIYQFDVLVLLSAESDPGTPGPPVYTYLDQFQIGGLQPQVASWDIKTAFTATGAISLAFSVTKKLKGNTQSPIPVVVNNTTPAILDGDANTVFGQSFFSAFLVAQ